uniref:Uncharacterized protein n=1 Tax=Setaria viridis TaxID=4556 RepID=A0A4U6THD3_SETVI|nr:hypothetical protein SEVIR_8G093500v2 [Setaria viridis]
MSTLKVATIEEATKKILNLQQPLQKTRTPRSPIELFSKVSQLAGDEVWFDHNSKVQLARNHSLIPVPPVFYRIKRSLPCATSPTIQEMDDALANLQATTTIAAKEELLPELWEEEVHVQQQEMATPAPPVQPEGHNTSNTNAMPDPTSAQVCPPTPVSASIEAYHGVAELFTTPEQGILPQPPLAHEK